MADILLDAECRLGEILAATPKHYDLGSRGRTKTLPADIDKKQSHEAQQLHKHRAIVEQCKTAARVAQNRRIFDLWLACWTEQEIAEATGVHRDTVNEICRNLADLPKSDKAAAEHATDFDPPCRRNAATAVLCENVCVSARFAHRAAGNPTAAPIPRPMTQSNGPDSHRNHARQEAPAMPTMVLGK
jgi:hypothetical protein